jgi:hypothetical protein
MRRTRGWSIVVTALAPACWGHASEDECRQMADHYVDLAAREASGGKLSPAQVEAVREVERGLKRAEPAYRRVEDRCAEVARSEVRCALGAETTQAWEACLRAGAANVTSAPQGNRDR